MDRLTALRAYVRLVEVGSFSQVARELRVKQSTVSKWLQQLEEELGARLVERTTRRQRVTEAGERFYEQARGVLAAWEAAVVAVDSAPRGRLRVSLPVVFGQRHVVPLLPSFLAANPAVTLELRFSDAYVDLVEEGVELALRVGTPAASSAVARTLAETPRALVASPDYLARRGRPERPEQLAEHDTLAHTPRAEWRVDGARVPVEARVAVDHSEAALALALAGCGVAMLARWLVDADLAAGRLEVVLPGRALPRAPIRVVWPSGRLSPGAAAFVAHLEADFRARWPRLTG